MLKVASLTIHVGVMPIQKLCTISARVWVIVLHLN